MILRRSVALLSVVALPIVTIGCAGDDDDTSSDEVPATDVPEDESTTEPSDDDTDADVDDDADVGDHADDGDDDDADDDAAAPTTLPVVAPADDAQALCFAWQRTFELFIGFSFVGIAPDLDGTDAGELLILASTPAIAPLWEAAVDSLPVDGVGDELARATVGFGEAMSTVAEHVEARDVDPAVTALFSEFGRPELDVDVDVLTDEELGDVIAELRRSLDGLEEELDAIFDELEDELGDDFDDLDFFQFEGDLIAVCPGFAGFFDFDFDEFEEFGDFDDFDDFDFDEFEELLGDFDLDELEELMGELENFDFDQLEGFFDDLDLGELEQILNNFDFGDLENLLDDLEGFDTDN